MLNGQKEYRVEKDFLGEKQIEADVYYGIQTLRASENFPITGYKIHEEMINALAIVKKAAALANMDVKRLYEGIGQLNKVKSLSNTFRTEIIDVLQTHSDQIKDELVSVPWETGVLYTRDEILHHIIAHEIHHIGQLSVWARELKLSPVSASFIGRTLKPIHSY